MSLCDAAGGCGGAAGRGRVHAPAAARARGRRQEPTGRVATHALCGGRRRGGERGAAEGELLSILQLCFSEVVLMGCGLCVQLFFKPKDEVGIVAYGSEGSGEDVELFVLLLET
ncbi:unnamed protein product [Phytophthora lilii]|uniref:Unnamed protein product n=1 Tax=Phytophthora lilii TaxID=2077276 RepID=A0A9W6WG47_9STRA|nr:unnamed protein product [Phytophthora lilii]